MDNGIYLNDLRNAVGNGFHEIRAAMAREDALDQAIGACCHRVANGRGHVADRPIMMTLASGKEVTIAAGDELCVRKGRVRFLSVMHGVMTEVALSAVQSVSYATEDVHPWD